MFYGFQGGVERDQWYQMSLQSILLFFPVNFTKFLRTAFFAEHIRQLLLIKHKNVINLSKESGTSYKCILIPKVVVVCHVQKWCVLQKSCFQTFTKAACRRPGVFLSVSRNVSEQHLLVSKIELGPDLKVNFSLDMLNQGRLI